MGRENDGVKKDQKTILRKERARENNKNILMIFFTILGIIISIIVLGFVVLIVYGLCRLYSTGCDPDFHKLFPRECKHKGKL